jgi:hypothetical protein
MYEVFFVVWTNFDERKYEIVQHLHVTYTFYILFEEVPPCMVMPWIFLPWSATGGAAPEPTITRDPGLTASPTLRNMYPNGVENK